jgi:hypothetical protein
VKEVEVATNSRKTRQPYQGQVRSQLEQMGDLGLLVNPYEPPPEDATEKPKPSKSSNEEPLWVQDPKWLLRLGLLPVVPQRR